jgi:hypothetical protein
MTDQRNGSPFDQVPSFKQLYKETYRPRRSWVNRAVFPASMPHLNKGVKASHIELRAAGRCTLAGQEYEFHDIRIYVDMP